LYGIKTIFVFQISFLFEKGMADRVLVKSNYVDSEPSLATETLSNLLLS